MVVVLLYRLTQVVQDKGPLKVCVCVCGLFEVKLELILTEMLPTVDCTRFSELLDYQSLTVTLIMTCGFVIVFL